MSMIKCKCDKIIDTDLEMNTDEKNEPCCDRCFREMFDEFAVDLNEAIEGGFNIHDGLDMEYVIESLMEKGYRCVK